MSGKQNRHPCSCLKCRNQITANNLSIHYESKQCLSGELFSNKLKRIATRELHCKFCQKIEKHRNAIAQHELYCKENPQRIIKVPSFGMKGKKGENQFSKAKKMGLPPPMVSRQTKEKMKRAKNENPAASYSSNESKQVFSKLLESITDYGSVYSAIHGREFFLRLNDKIFFYDLVFRDLKLIVEYQGVAWHPKSLDDNFRVPHKDMGTAQQVWEKDRLKERIAIENGFKVLYIWSDNVENDLNKVKMEVLLLTSKQLSV
jgi:very-short-patch-repair endonuclease